MAQVQINKEVIEVSEDYKALVLAIQELTHAINRGINLNG